MKKIDNVNHPPHYNQQSIECIDAIQCATGEGFENYLQGNIMTVSYTHLTLPTKRIV